MLPLLTILTLGSFRSCLQYWTNFPRKSPLSCRKGSPPEKLIFSMPNEQQYNRWTYCEHATVLGNVNNLFFIIILCSSFKFTRFLQKFETPLCLIYRQDKRRFRRVETKATFVVALARKMVIDTGRGRCVLDCFLWIQIAVNRCSCSTCKPPFPPKATRYPGLRIGEETWKYPDAKLQELLQRHDSWRAKHLGMDHHTVTDSHCSMWCSSGTLNRMHKTTWLCWNETYLGYIA